MTTLARIDSMDSAAAAADAAELARIAARAQAIAARLGAAFAPAAGLAGVATDSASHAGRSLAERIETTGSDLTPAASALTNAAGALARSEAARGHIAGLATLGGVQNRAAIVSSVLTTLMVTSYNIPMSSGTQFSAGPTGGGRSHAGGAGPVSMLDGPAADRPHTRSVGDAADQTVGGTPVAPRPERPGPAPGPDRAVRPDAAAARTGPSPSPGGPTALGGSPTTGDRPAGPSPAAPFRGSPGAVTPTVRPSGSPPPRSTATGAASSSRLGGTPSASPPSGPRVSSPLVPTRSAMPAGAQPVGAAPAAGTHRSGAGGVPGVGPGAARSREEESRRAASYLRSTSEGELLLGEQPLVTPAVLAPPVEPAQTADDGEGPDAKT